MEELVDDPLVLDAALTLVDEWYQVIEKGDTPVRKAPSPASSTSFQGLRKRAHEDLASLRSTVQNLQHRTRKRRGQLPESPPLSVETESDGHTSEESAEETAVPTRQVQYQATRLLYAIHSCNQLQAAIHVTLSLIERTATGPSDAQILTAFSSRLDQLTAIARATPSPSSLGKDGFANDVSFTLNCFRGRLNGISTLPFKLSIVADVMWNTTQLVRLGPEKKKQLSVQRHNEAIAMLTTDVNTPSGFMAAQGVTALRRVDEEDGSVLLLHSMISASPPEPRRLGGEETTTSRPNLLAGCTVKQAGWTRLRVDRGQGHGRPLVQMERSVGIVVEASAGCSVSKERLKLILRMLGEMGAAEERSPQWLENRMLDASLARSK